MTSFSGSTMHGPPLLAPLPAAPKSAAAFVGAVPSKTGAGKSVTGPLGLKICDPSLPPPAAASSTRFGAAPPCPPDPPETSDPPSAKIELFDPPHDTSTAAPVIKA